MFNCTTFYLEITWPFFLHYSQHAFSKPQIYENKNRNYIFYFSLYGLLYTYMYHKNIDKGVGSFQLETNSTSGKFRVFSKARCDFL